MYDMRDVGTYAIMLLLSPLFLVVFVCALAVCLPIVALHALLKWLSA